MGIIFPLTRKKGRELDKKKKKKEET